MVQVFHFLSETLESYYCRRLLCVSNNHLDTYIALRFQGLNASKIPKESIQETDHNVYVVKSKSDRGITYTVDMAVGVCTCPQGIDGSPCSHQAAVAVHYSTASINCIPTLAPCVRQIYAQIALGEEAEQNISFYASLHDKELITSTESDKFYPDFTSPSMDVIRSEAKSENEDKDNSCELQKRIQDTCLAIDNLAQDLKKKLEEKKNSFYLALRSLLFAMKNLY